MNKKVSIIVPCYNGECFVDRCMRSIGAQDYPYIEIIIVNDGSTDQSENKILPWKEIFEKKGITLIYVSQTNKGPGGAINTGLKYVSGDYLSLLDIDDEYLPGAVSERVRYLECHSDTDVVRSNGWYVRANEKSLFIYDENEKNIEDVFTALIEGKTNNWAGSYMVRTSVLFRFYPDREIYQSRYGQNLQFLLPLVYHKKCGYLDKPHMNYNQEENSLTKTTDFSNAKKLSLKNAKGYRDIREHMIHLIVQTEKEAEYFLKLVDVAYWRSIMQIAAISKDGSLMGESYGELKRIVKPSIDDRIIYCRLIHSELAPFLRIARKLRTIVQRICKKEH